MYVAENLWDRPTQKDKKNLKLGSTDAGLLEYVSTSFAYPEADIVAQRLTFFFSK